MTSKAKKRDTDAFWKSPSQGTTSGRPSPTRIVLVSLIALGGLAAIGLWTSHAVWESLVNVYSSKLQTVLNADIAALRIWVQNEINHVKAYSEDPDLQKDVEALLALRQEFPEDTERLRRSSPLRDIQERFLSLQVDMDFLGYVVVDHTGLIIASNEAEPYIGMRHVPEFLSALAKVFQGTEVFQKPALKGTHLGDIAVEANRPIILTAAPIWNKNREIIAALGIVLNPDKDFTRILSVARLGESGDTYAFDEDGFLLSDSRHQEQLKAIGLLPDTHDARSILAVQIRDPGGDMTRGYRPQAAVADRPLTRMAAAAVSGKSGVDIKGYRDYRGVTVIGAWQWLPEYGFGVATEVRKIEAFAGHRPVKIAFIALFGVTIIACGWSLYSSLSMQHLKQRIDEIKQLGQYRLLEKIGEGGMGKVYRASHALLKRQTAVKLLKPEAVNAGTVQRFEREVQLTSRLTHPNTVQVYDYGKTDAGIFYYAMEFLNGIDLAQLVELDGPVAPERVIYILKHVCLSLEEAHRIGLIHRDIKPLNIMLCELGSRYDAVKVLDFGLVKEIDNQDRVELTTDQGVLGTPVYIAPERLEGKKEIDVRSDFYSLGAVAFNLLTGKDVYDASTTVEICYHVLKTPAPRPSEMVDFSIPPLLDQLVFDCLAKDPSCRPASASEIIENLEAQEAEYPWDQAAAYRWWQQHADQIRQIRSRRETA